MTCTKAKYTITEINWMCCLLLLMFDTLAFHILRLILGGLFKMETSSRTNFWLLPNSVSAHLSGNLLASVPPRSLPLAMFIKRALYQSTASGLSCFIIILNFTEHLREPFPCLVLLPIQTLRPPLQHGWALSTCTVWTAGTNPNLQPSCQFNLWAMWTLKHVISPDTLMIPATLA